MKKKPSTYTRAGRSNVTLKNFLNNLKENDLHFENNQITQCVFLGVLRLKPVPSMFCNSAAVSADSILEVKNRNKRNRRVGNNNTCKELNKNSGHKGDINKVISGRISKKDTTRVKQSVKKVPVTQSILKVNLKMSKKQETPSMASCLSNSIILADTKIIPQCASFPRSPIEDQSIPNPVQNLFNKLKQQIDERNHQQESPTDLTPTRKLKYKSNKRKTLQDRLPMPLQSGGSSIEIDSDSSGFKDDGITCSSSDTNSISPVSQNSADDKIPNKEVILIEDEDAQKNDDVVILDGPSKSLLSVDTSQNRDVIVMDPPKVLRVSPRIKRVDETSTDMRELRVTVPTNDDNNSNDPSSSLLQTFMQGSDSDKPRKRRKLMPMAMPSIFFNTPMLLRSELAQKKGAPVDNRPAARAAPRLTKSETKQEKPVLKLRKDQYLDKTEESEIPSKNNDNLIYEVVKSSEAASSSDKEIIVIDDVSPKVEPLILKLRVSPQKASTSKTTAQSASDCGIRETVLSQKLSPPEKKYKLQQEESCGPAAIINSVEEISPNKQVSDEQKIEVIEDTPDLSKLDENKLQCIIIEDDEKSSEMEKTSSDDIIFVAHESNVKSINSEPATQPKITLVKESVLKSPQSNDSVIQTIPEQSQSIIGQNAPIDPQDKTETIKESVLSESKETMEEKEVILIETPVLIKNKISPNPQPNIEQAFSNQISSELQNTVIDIVKPDTEPIEDTNETESRHEDAQRREEKSELLVDISKNEDASSADIKIPSTDPNISANIDTNNGMKDPPIPKASMHEIDMPLLATSRVLRSEKSQQKSTEQTCSVGQAAIDAKVTAMKMEEPQKGMTDQKNERRSAEPEEKDADNETVEIPTEATPRLLKSQSKPADQKNKSITDEMALLEPEKTPQEMRRKEEYVNPPEATSRVLRSEKSQPKSLDQKNKSNSASGNKELDGTFIMFPGATARVLRSEKMQQKVSNVSPKLKEDKISEAEDVKNNGKVVSLKIKTEDKSDEKSSNKSGKRSLRSSIASAVSESSSSYAIHEKPKRGAKTRPRKEKSQNSEEVPRQAVKKVEKPEIHIGKIGTKVRGKASTLNPSKKDNTKQKTMAAKKQERNKKIIKRVLRSSEIKHPQPEIGEVMVKTKPRAPKIPQKSGNKKSTGVKKQNESALSKAKMTKLNKLRKIVSIKTKKIAKEKKMVDWKNNQIIEEIIQELKNTIFKNEPDVNGSQLARNSAAGKSAKKNTKVPKRPVKIGGNQKNRPKAANPAQIQKRKFNAKKKKPLARKCNPTKMGTKDVKKQSAAQVIEETREAVKMTTRRTGSRRKMEPEQEAPTPKPKEPRAGNRKSSRKVIAKETIIEDNNVKEPKKAKAGNNKNQRLENALKQDEQILPAEIDGTPLIIEVDSSLNEKKKKEETAVVIVDEEKTTQETSKLEGKRKTPPASSDQDKKKSKVLKQSGVEEPPAEEEPTDEAQKPAPGTWRTPSSKKTSIIIPDEEPTVASQEPAPATWRTDSSKKTSNIIPEEEPTVSTTKPAPATWRTPSSKKTSIIVPGEELTAAAREPAPGTWRTPSSKKTSIVIPEEEPTVEARAPDTWGTHFSKRTSIIIHDDVVLPERKGDITVFDFEETEEAEAAAPPLRRSGKLWSRINANLPRRKKKMWSVVEQPAPRGRPPLAERRRDDVFAPPPPVKREVGARGAGAEPVAAVGVDVAQPSGSADTAGSPVKSEPPMKQLTITEMFGKFSKKKSPPRPTLDPPEDSRSKAGVRRESPEVPLKAPPPPPADVVLAGPSRREEAQPSLMPPPTPTPAPTKTETRRYSRIDNAADDDDSDCESRAEWVPEEYAEYKFKYSAQKMMQVKPIFKCKVCLALLPSYYKLVKHKKCHENVDNPYNCGQCGALFNNVEDFSAHLRAHKGKHPYECLKCSMGFWTKQAYEEHAPVHVLRKQKPSVKRFRCDICAKEFSKLCDVERHTRVHTGEKPCVCNICNKGFQQSHNLSKHLLTHLHIKPFQCEICNRQFGRNDVLNRHLLTHSIEKPVKCWVCSKGFIRHTQLVVHLMNHHPDQPLEDPDLPPSAKEGGDEESKTDEEGMGDK